HGRPGFQAGCKPSNARSNDLRQTVKLLEGFRRHRYRRHAGSIAGRRVWFKAGASTILNRNERQFLCGPGMDALRSFFPRFGSAASWFRASLTSFGCLLPCGTMSIQSVESTTEARVMSRIWWTLAALLGTATGRAAGQATQVPLPAELVPANAR